MTMKMNIRELNQNETEMVNGGSEYETSMDFQEFRRLGCLRVEPWNDLRDWEEREAVLNHSFFPFGIYAEGYRWADNLYYIMTGTKSSDYIQVSRKEAWDIVHAALGK